MSFSDRFSKTKVNENIKIALEGENVVGASILFTPNKNKPEEHYHVHLNANEIEILYTWCIDYIYHPNIKEKYFKDILWLPSVISHLTCDV